MASNNILKRHLFVLFGTAGLILLFVTNLIGAQYDATGILGGLYWLSYVLSLPYQLIKELLFSIVGTESVFLYDLIASISHVGIFYLADRVASKVKDNLTNKDKSRG